MRRPFQKLRFWLYHWRWATSFIWNSLARAFYRHTPLGVYKGITITTASVRPSKKEFLQHTVEALQLIERTDSRRFKRVQREVQFIVHAQLNSGASYLRRGRLRLCLVDYLRYDFSSDHDWCLYCYASALVHEATHGAVYSHYVGITRRNYLRIEALCTTEERRFLARLDTPERCWSQQIAEFDEQYFLRYYNESWLSRIAGLWRRISEARKANIDGRRN